MTIKHPYITESMFNSLVSEMREEMFSSPLDDLVSPSAYDTAWVAMIPDPDAQNQPLFRQCLDWLVQTQNEEGFWGEPATIECLSTTLACILALKTWNMEQCNVEKGLAFFHANAEKLLGEEGDNYPRWFCIVFPAMVDSAETKGVNVFPGGMPDIVQRIYHQRQRILEMKGSVGEVEAFHHPVLSYLEALPPSIGTGVLDQLAILENQSQDGSLFQSPSATAQAFMMTRNKGFRLYLESMLQRFGDGGVPCVYPVDEQLIKLCLVDRLERLGLSEHFSEEIEDVLTDVYGNWILQEPEGMSENRLVPLQMYKDSLAFRLLRMRGYRVSPERFCWFLEHEHITSYMEENYECMLSTLLNVYRATEIMFLGENELEKARSFSKKLLQRGLTMRNIKDSVVTFNSQEETEHELGLPWLARLDHLAHRVSIEGSESNDYLWMGKASYYRLSFLNNNKLLHLAEENYRLRQSIFMKELEELTRWSRDSGLQDMGFGREKTTYCYFSVACNAYFPSLSDVRMLISKSAILVTVADDFFDMEGSLDELNALTQAVERWNGEGLFGHCKVIFDALDDLVNQTIKMLQHQYCQINVTKTVRGLWCETFVSWLKEAEWSRRWHAPSIDEYIKIGMTSIAVHTMILPASYMISPGLPLDMMRQSHADTITRLLMVSARLLNDMQSYQKEKEDGKSNIVLLYLKENPNLDIENSIDYIRKILDQKKKELLKMALEVGNTRVSKPCRHLHLSGLKAFQMFFNSNNNFDSPTELIESINKAIYEPLMVESQCAPLQPYSRSKKCNSIVRNHIGRSFHDHNQKKFLFGLNTKPLEIRKTTNHLALRLPIAHHSQRSYARVLMPPIVLKTLFC